MASAKDRESVTITWPASLLNFVKGPLFEKTRIKTAQLSQLAMENYLKENGYWEAYQTYLSQDIM